MGFWSFELEIYANEPKALYVSEERCLLCPWTPLGYSNIYPECNRDERRRTRSCQWDCPQINVTHDLTTGLLWLAKRALSLNNTGDSFMCQQLHQIIKVHQTTTKTQTTEHDQMAQKQTSCLERAGLYLIVICIKKNTICFQGLTTGSAWVGLVWLYKVRVDTHPARCGLGLLPLTNKKKPEK